MSFLTTCGGRWVKLGTFDSTSTSIHTNLYRLLGITADEDYGGLAMGYQAHCTVMEELSRASGNSSTSPLRPIAHNVQVASDCHTPHTRNYV
jgi:isovaleryl-CoA dehydrogenase